ncbi:hypothetical protein [Bosea sp. AS-1]|uniref:hypothetical protein n=1 Tax=Bosea sp. AS-1 TaxID=2015316 RepID=UPI000B7820AB|nr:hypothetical protein [Bosea sp. AS-1]
MSDLTTPVSFSDHGRGREGLIDQTSRLLAAGWRGNPNMSGDDRDFMTPSMRRRHDDKARSVVEFVAASLPQLSPWRDLASAPEDEWVLLATTGGWVGEAMVIEGEWKWASGNVFHSDIVPLKWMPLPEHPESSGRNRADATPKNPLSEGRERS